MNFWTCRCVLCMCFSLFLPMMFCSLFSETVFEYLCTFNVVLFVPNCSNSWQKLNVADVKHFFVWFCSISERKTTNYLINNSKTISCFWFRSRRKRLVCGSLSMFLKPYYCTIYCHQSKDEFLWNNYCPSAVFSRYQSLLSKGIIFWTYT